MPDVGRSARGRDTGATPDSHDDSNTTPPSGPDPYDTRGVIGPETEMPPASAVAPVSSEPANRPLQVLPLPGNVAKPPGRAQSQASVQHSKGERGHAEDPHESEAER